MPATTRQKLCEMEEPAMTVNDLCNRVARNIMIEKLVLENDFATAFNEINSQPTRSEDFFFLQAQQQSLQKTQQAIVSQIDQISSQLKSMKVQRQQDKANPTEKKRVEPVTTNNNRTTIPMVATTAAVSIIPEETDE